MEDRRRIAAWISDDEPGDVTAWRAGRLRTADGETMVLSTMVLEEEEKDAVREEAAALGREASRNGVGPL